MSKARPLGVLRAEIDAIDHAVLSLLSQRMSLVTEIAALKRTEGWPLRDPDRERELRADRARTAVSMGLPAALSNAVFHAVLRSSREHLAALGVPRGGTRGRGSMRAALAARLARWSAWLDEGD